MLAKGTEMSNIMPLSPPQPKATCENTECGTQQASKLNALLRSSSLQSKDVLEIDKRTPDSWVQRDPRMIRLTSVHPFNAEAPLSLLYNEGFITSPELFYVRNHGPVPRVTDDDVLEWNFTVEGMVEIPLDLTISNLITDFEQKTYPVTLVCAGNRRKEQNVVRKTKGFSWGAAGVSTAIFTGVSMADVLKRAKPQKGAKYVYMEGADALPNGNYGTSIKLCWALDANRGTMLAYGMNGEALLPDHGKPLRAVIPGQIGGRSVKWLKKLIIMDKPSENWYHTYDNRVLPTMVSPEESSADLNWWKDERYAIYDLSPNSAVVYPAHEEKLCLDQILSTYLVQGYAYGGGGRRITRVEVTLDRGRTWKLARVKYPEDDYRAASYQSGIDGRTNGELGEACFCWCFWHIEISITELGKANDILVRSMDDGMNVQPRDIYWNVLGMMNNQWYRVVVLQKGNFLHFEHPTQPALQSGGWMERVKKTGGNLTNGFWGERDGYEEDVQPATKNPSEIKMTKEHMREILTSDDLRKHSDDREPWFIVDGEVYDGTNFLKKHPGGAQSIISAAGQDCTDEFMAIHSETAKAMMPNYHVGSLDNESRLNLSGLGDVENGEDGPRGDVFLEPRRWKRALLRRKEKLSWDTRLFTYELEHDEQELGLPTGQHVMMRIRQADTGEAIIRSYTPYSHANTKGMFAILIKVYFDSPEKKGGKMSQAMDALPMGSSLDFKGPIGKFIYEGRGRCIVHNTTRNVKSFIMICGGSGITPIYQVFRAIMLDKEDPTRCTVIDGNRCLEDILCKDDLDALAGNDSKKCQLLYTLTQAPKDWTGLQGRIAEPLLAQYCHRRDVQEHSAMVLICGPKSLEETVHRALMNFGWSDDDLLFF